MRKPAAKIYNADQEMSRRALWICKEETSKQVSDDLSCMHIVISEKNMNVLQKNPTKTHKTVLLTLTSVTSLL